MIHDRELLSWRECFSRRQKYLVGAKNFLAARNTRTRHIILFRRHSVAFLDGFAQIRYRPETSMNAGDLFHIEAEFLDLLGEQDRMILRRPYVFAKTARKQIALKQ